MDMNRIKYFISLGKTGSLSKAAEIHHISPAAFSKAMKIFQSEIGMTLFIADGRGIKLTDRAVSILPKLENILDDLENIKKTKDSFQNEKTLKIASFEVFSTHFMERCMSKSFKDFNLLIHEMIPGEMETAVANYQVDLALTYLPIPHPDLDFLKVQQIEMGIFGLKNHFSVIEKNITPFAIPISPLQGSPNKVRGLDGWPESAFARNTKYQVTMLETALGLCRRGLCVVYIPKFMARLHNEIVKPEFYLEEKFIEQKIPKNKSFIYLVKRKSDIEGEQAKKIASLVRTICSEA
jgi:DNA-binding transcriptional LysR family regulator